MNAVACVLVVAAISAGVARADSHEYTFPTGKVGLGVHTIRLDRARVRWGGHVAIWVDVASPAETQWLQAGVAVGPADGNPRTATGKPYLYLERTGGRLIVVRPVRYGETVTVWIACSGPFCRAWAAGRRLGAWVPHWSPDGVGESYELDGPPNRYRGAIDGRPVSQ